MQPALFSAREGDCSLHPESTGLPSPDVLVHALPEVRSGVEVDDPLQEPRSTRSGHWRGGALVLVGYTRMQRGGVDASCGPVVQPVAAIDVL